MISLGRMCCLLTVFTDGQTFSFILSVSSTFTFHNHKNSCSVFSAEKQTCLSQLHNSKLDVGHFLQTSHGHCIECDFLLADLLPRHGNLSGLVAKTES